MQNSSVPKIAGIANWYGLGLSIGAFIVGAIIISYASQTYDTCNGQVRQQDDGIRSMGIALQVLGSLLLIASIGYWVLFGLGDMTRLSGILDALGNR